MSSWPMGGVESGRAPRLATAERPLSIMRWAVCLADVAGPMRCIVVRTRRTESLGSGA